MGLVVNVLKFVADDKSKKCTSAKAANAVVSFSVWSLSSLWK